jgi:hypothetical protein
LPHTILVSCVLSALGKPTKCARARRTKPQMRQNLICVFTTC